MLPSTGLFKSFACPYYNSAGNGSGSGSNDENGEASFNCKRPFCHFKHNRKGECVCVSSYANT